MNHKNSRQMSSINSELPVHQSDGGGLKKSPCEFSLPCTMGSSRPINALTEDSSRIYSSDESSYSIVSPHLDINSQPRGPTATLTLAPDKNSRHDCNTPTGSLAKESPSCFTNRKPSMVHNPYFHLRRPPNQSEGDTRKVIPPNQSTNAASREASLRDPSPQPSTSRSGTSSSKKIAKKKKKYATAKDSKNNADSSNSDENSTGDYTKSTKHRVEVVNGSGVYIDAIELKDMRRRWLTKPRELVRRLLKALIGKKRLMKMTLEGTGDREKIPKLIYRVIRSK